MFGVVVALGNDALEAEFFAQNDKAGLDEKRREEANADADDGHFSHRIEPHVATEDHAAEADERGGRAHEDGRNDFAHSGED